MMFVLAHCGDEIARRLAARWGARMITARELSIRGWRHHPVGGGDDVLGLDDGPLPARAVGGVVTRLSGIAPAELVQIAEGDRDYIAAEMTAFLLSFLRRLTCPVLNRPTASSLMGISWTTPRWRAAAIAAGLRISLDDADADAVTVTVIGERTFGATGPAAAAAVALATHCGAELLTARFTRTGELLDVNPWADLSDDAADAIRARFT